MCQTVCALPNACTQVLIMMIEPHRADERAQLLSLAVQTGLFSAAEAEALLGSVLDALAAGSLPEGHQTMTCRAAAGGPALGWSYVAPDPYADGVWNVWWIGVAPDHQGTGVSRRLLEHVEHTVRAAGARVVVIETSDKAAQARARRFYAKFGYTECGRIPDFYARGEAKVIYARTLGDAA